MNRYGSKKHRVAAGLALVALMVVVAVVATTVEPEANALPFGGGVPVRVWFNQNPAVVGDEGLQLWVEISASASIKTQNVRLYFPLELNPHKYDGDPATDELQAYPPTVPVEPGFTEGYITISAKNAGWVAVLAKDNGGRAGGVLEIVE